MLVPVLVPELVDRELLDPEDPLLTLLHCVVVRRQREHKANKCKEVKRTLNASRTWSARAGGIQILPSRFFSGFKTPAVYQKDVQRQVTGLNLIKRKQPVNLNNGAAHKRSGCILVDIINLEDKLMQTQSERL